MKFLNDLWQLKKLENLCLLFSLRSRGSPVNEVKLSMNLDLGIKNDLSCF